jgi:hypothetical protein
MKYIYLALIVFMAGCVQTPSTVAEGLLVKVDASSKTVFQGKEINVFVDIENKMFQDAKNVRADIFENPYFRKTICSPRYTTPLGNFGYIPVNDIDEGGLQIVTCSLRVIEEIPKDQLETDISAGVTFDSRLQASQVVKLISQEEFDVRQKTKELAQDPKTYTYKDSNVELAIEFSSQPPLVSGSNREFVKFKIRNIGNGFIKGLDLEKDFRFVQNPEINGNKIVDGSCLSGKIEPIKNEFPSITCELNMPDINYLSNSILIINIDYQYEVRNKISVKILR